jgi:hypothetical protein
MEPLNWPKEFIYTKAPFSDDLHPMILNHLLSTGKEDDLEKIHPLIEKEAVHPDLEIKTITDADHPLASPTNPQRGLFAKKEIPEGSDLGTYAGEITLMNANFEFKKGDYDYALVLNLSSFYYVVNSRKCANEMVFINDYRGIAKAPNVKAAITVHKGVYYPMFCTITPILPGQELLWDYGNNYWKMR